MTATNIHAASNQIIAKAMAKDPSIGAAKSSNPAGVVKRSNAYFIDPKAITRVEGWNPRFDFGEIESLATSIKSNGILVPIRVKRLAAPVEGKVFELIDGDRRLTAIEAILKKDPAAFPDGVPAIIVDKNQDDITSLIQMFEANSGKSFLPLEEAAAYQRMREAGMTLKQIGDAVGRKHVHIVGVMNLLNADDSVKEAATSGKIGKTLAKQIATVAKGDVETQKKLVEEAKAAGTDKVAQRRVKDSVNKAHRAAATKRGAPLKIRALSDQELSDIGMKMAEHLAAKLAEMGVSLEEDLVAMIKKDPKMVMAYGVGALDALKVAAGGVNNLFLD